MIALVDCNNFFASCERLFRPDLKGEPVLVLSNNDGCVIARSDEVKALAVPMGVPYFKIRDTVAKNNVHCFSSNFALYSNMSQRILTVLQRHTPQIEVYSIDEAFMQLGSVSITDMQSWGDSLRDEIKREIGIPVSVGVAPTKLLAKLASAYAKKHQQTCIIDPKLDLVTYQRILSETDVGAVWGVGWQLAPRFRRAGIHTAWQLAQTSAAWLHSQHGITGKRMHDELNGHVGFAFDDTTEPQKSMMASRSFGHTITRMHELESAVASFASQAAYRLRRHSLTTGRFGLYLRYKDLEGQTKSQSASVRLSPATSDTSELVSVALNILRQLYDPLHGYKKAGVFAYNLASSLVSQVDLFDTLSPHERQRRGRLMTAIDSINQRFGAETMHIGVINPRDKAWHAKKERLSPAYTTDWSQLPLVHRLQKG